MTSPEHSKRSEILEVGRLFYEERQQGYVDPHLRRRKIERTLPLGQEITIQIHKKSLVHTKIYTDPKTAELFSREDLSRSVKLTKTEQDIVDVLIENNRRVVPHGVLNRLVWGYEAYNGSDLSKMHISALRAKLRQIGVDPNILFNVSSVGYGISDVSEDESEIERESSVDKVVSEKKYNFPFGTLHPEKYIFESEAGIRRFTKAELGIVKMLCEHENRPVAREYLLRFLDEESDLSVLKTHISHIRKKIANGRELDVPTIVGVAKVGYMIVNLLKMSPAEKESFLRNLSPDQKRLRQS